MHWQDFIFFLRVYLDVKAGVPLVDIFLTFGLLLIFSLISGLLSIWCYKITIRKRRSTLKRVIFLFFLIVSALLPGILYTSLLHEIKDVESFLVVLLSNSEKH